MTITWVAIVALAGVVLFLFLHWGSESNELQKRGSLHIAFTTMRGGSRQRLQP